MPINENLKKTLSALHVAASQNPAGYHTFSNPKAPAVAKLINSKHLLADHSTKDPTDPAKIAVTLSDDGKSELELGHQTPVPVTQPSFGGTAGTTQEGQEGQEGAGETEVLNDKVKRGKRGPRVTPVVSTNLSRMALPEIVDGRRSSKKAETYPFASLEAPNEQGLDAFHVAATEAMPNPAKTLAGTVSSANKRHKKEGIEPKEFKVIESNHPVTGAPGAMVYRVK
jgi:hypothetical protein